MSVDRDLKGWVRRVQEEHLLGKCLQYLKNKGRISEAEYKSATNASDFGQSSLLSTVTRLQEDAPGRELLGKLMNLVRQWRASAKRAKNGGSTRKVVLSPEADEFLERQLKSPDVLYNASGYIDFLLRDQAGLAGHHEGVVAQLRDKMEQDNAAKALRLKEKEVSLQRREAKLARRRERLDARVEEVAELRKLKASVLKASKVVEERPGQEIVLHLDALTFRRAGEEVTVRHGSQKHRLRLQSAVSAVVEKLLNLIER